MIPSPDMEALALADDLTGALETGAKFAALVTTSREQSCLPRRVLVIDTESRHLSPSEAAERITMASAANHARLIYKKTDSALRGNIGAELGALLAVHADSPLIYVPAYPAMGRTVKRGHLHVHGSPAHQSAFANDALNPVSDSDIARVLRKQTQAPIFSIAVEDLKELEPGAIYICDGESDAEIAEAARVLTNGAGRMLAAGPAAFAEAIAQRIGLPKGRIQPWPKIESCLVINGSRHELSLRQVCHAKELGWRVADANSIPDPQWVILDAAGDAQTIGAMVRGILTHRQFEALTIFGGDTAYGILSAIGEPALYPLGEIVPGVPLSKAADRDLYLITKAGGFGPVDVLPKIRNALL
jgi:D-threonate/D-erythronate kinase